MKRCPNGSRRNKKTNMCKKIPVNISRKIKSKSNNIYNNVLLSQIISSINDFVNCTTEDYKKMIKICETEPRYIQSASIIKINSNYTLEIIKQCTKEINRTDDIIKLIQETLKYIKYLKLPMPNTTIFLYVSDVYAFEHQDLPFFVITKPKNKTGILIPDNTFYSHTTVSSKSESWEETMKKCINNHIPTNKKQNTIFFRGANTDSGRQNIRNAMYNLSHNKSVYNLNLNGLNKHKQNIFNVELKGRQPIETFTKYKYLLNLPGNQPWSYRFKYLFLMKSVVININVKQKYKNTKDINDTWINFFDILLEPNVDYIELPFQWNEGEDKHNILQLKKLISNIKHVYEKIEMNPELYEKIAKNGFNKIKEISNKMIYNSIYHLLYNYANIMNPILGIN